MRRKKLHFVCDCIACIEDWPIVEKKEPIPELIAAHESEQFSCNFDRGMVDDNLTRVLAYLRKYDGHYPCEQLTTARKVFGHLENLMYGIEIPMRVRYYSPQELYSQLS